MILILLFEHLNQLAKKFIVCVIISAKPYLSFVPKSTLSWQQDTIFWILGSRIFLVLIIKLYSIMGAVFSR